MNVRRDEQRIYATVFVPDGKLGHFEGLLRDYLEQRRDSIGRPWDNRKLIDAIHQIRVAALRALWTDDIEVFPTEDDEPLWWEVWLPVRRDRAASIASFRSQAQAQNLEVSQGELDFPERTVFLVYGSSIQMTQSMITLNSIAELRLAKETAESFDSVQPDEQTGWLAKLLARTEYSRTDETVPHVCLLDTGVNNGHRLLRPAVADPDLHTVEPAWGAADSDGYGTSMAGLALAGDLTKSLASAGRIKIGHRLESVKLLRDNGANGNDARHHDYLTTEAVARPETVEPNRHRVYGMAVTARDNRDRGRPSAWSAAVDRLAADADGEGANPRLFVISAGNITDSNAGSAYPSSNGTDGIHDPGQAWNALTIGAYTELIQITEPDAGHYEPIAPTGGLSPFSTTSMTWQRQMMSKND